MNKKPIIRWATTSARLAAGTIVVVAFVIGVVTAVSAPIPSVGITVPSVQVEPTPEPGLIACTGPVQALARDAADASGLSLAAEQQVTAGVRTESLPAVESELTASVAPGPLAYTAEPVGRQRGDVAASGSSELDAEDLAGYAASACRPPLAQSWLVGGSGAIGAADLIVLANPGAVPATVELTIYGTEGARVPPGGAGIIVAPGTQMTLPLAGFLLGEGSPVVRVSATGTPVVASLQTSFIRTLVPQGIDQVPAVQTADTRQQIVGVSIPEADATGEDAPARTLLRVISPFAATTATVTISAEGKQGSPSEPFQLEEGIPIEVDLGRLAVGTYTVTVDAPEPLVSAVWHSTGEDANADFAWFTPAPTLTASSMFATPAGPSPALMINNSADTDQAVVLRTADGSMRTDVSAPAGTSVILALEPQKVYVLDPPAEGIQAAVSLSDPGRIAGFPLWHSPGVADPITIYP